MSDEKKQPEERTMSLQQLNMGIIREMATIAPAPGEDGKPSRENEQMALDARNVLAQMGMAVALTRLANAEEAKLANGPRLFVPGAPIPH